MKNHSFARLRGATLAVCVAAAGMTPALAAQDSFKQTLPERTLVYASAPDLNKWWAGFQTSPIYKIWLEEEMQEFLADLLDEAKKQYANAMAQAKQMHDEGALPVDPAKLEQIRVKSMSFAVTDAAMPGPNGPGKFSIAMSIDFGDTSSIVAEMMDTMMPMALGQAPEGAIETGVEEIEGVTMKTIKSPMAAMMMPTSGLMYGFVDGKMVVGTDLEVTRTIVAGLKGKAPEASLASEPEYAFVSDRVGAKKGEVEFFMRPKALMDIGLSALRFAAAQSPEMSEQVDIDGIARAIDVLGLNGLKSIGMSSGYDGGKGFTKSFVHCPEGERKGLMALASDAPIDMGHLAWIPKGVSAFSIARMGNLENIYTTIMDAVKAYDEGVAEMASSEIAKMEEGLGFSIQKDAFGAFSDELINYSMPVSGLMATPEMVFLMGCKDAQKTLGVLKKLCGMSEGVVSISEVAGEEALYSVDLTLDEFGGGMDPTGMLDPTIGFKDGYFIFALSRSDVKGAIARFGGTNDSDVRENSAFKPYLEMIPQGANAVSFTDVASTVDGLYGSLSGIIGMVPIPPEVPVDVGLLPSTEAITKHLFGSVSWGRSIPKGFIAENVGPFGPEMMIGIAALAAGVGVGAAMMGARGPMAVRRR